MKKADRLYVCSGNSNLAAPLDEDLVLLTRFLYTKKIPFKLTFFWNPCLPVRENILTLTLPHRICERAMCGIEESE